MAVISGYYPATYQPYGQQYVQQYQQPQYQAQAMAPATQSNQQMQQVNQPIQNGGFVYVRSEEEARAYPVALGTSITFKNETSPYFYTKTMGFSQFEAPRFEKFRIIKEVDEEPEEENQKDSPYALKDDLASVVTAFKELSGVVSAIKGEMDSMKGDIYGVVGKKRTTKKAEVEEDDE